MRHLNGLAVASAVILSFVLSGGARAQDALARAKAAGVLQVATEEQYPPFDFIKDGKHVGFNVDLLDDVSKIMGIKIEYTDLPWASVLPGLEARKYDLVAGPAAITAARVKLFRFLPPISQSQTAIMIRKGYTGIRQPADMSGKKIGVQRAATASNELKKYAATMSVPPVVTEYVDYNQANADLAAGRLDGVANTTTNILYAAAQRPDMFDTVLPGFGNSSFSSFLGRNDADSKSLLDAVAAAMLDVKKEGGLAEIQKKWLGKAIDLPDEAPAP